MALILIQHVWRVWFNFFEIKVIQPTRTFSRLICADFDFGNIFGGLGKMTIQVFNTRAQTIHIWYSNPNSRRMAPACSRMRASFNMARMREQAGAIRRELGLLYQDVDRLGTRVENLDRHFAQAAKDITEIKISADKAGKRARRLDNFDFEEIKSDTPNMLDQN